MKQCPNCEAEVVDGFEICWNCNYSFTQNKVLEFTDLQPGERDIDCLRCNVRLLFAGNYKFHEGPKFGFFGNLLEAFVNRESFDIYVCPKCGKAEFYTPLS